MPLQSCTIPEVDRALSPYINTRDDTLKIRRTLSKYLTANIRPVNTTTQNQHLNQECPHSYSAVNTAPPGLKDTRLRYLQALRARLQAQARHRELQSSLQELQEHHIQETSGQSESEYDNEVTRNYVSLLRQRRRFAELQVIQESLEKLLNADPPVGLKDPKARVKDAIGEQPDLPAERLEQLSRGQDDQTWIFKLKKEVLEAKAGMDRANSDRVEARNQRQGIPSLSKQIHALNCARSEIVEWVEGELAKMNEESEFLEDASPIKGTTANTTTTQTALSEDDMRQSYNQYTACRAALVEAHGLIAQPAARNSKTSNDASGNKPDLVDSKDPLASEKPITDILPHLPCLARTAGNERSLLQQTVYMQAQISSANEEITDALLRLSGESHLLPSGSKGVEAWGKTAAETEANTERVVKGNLQESRHEVSTINTIVDLCSLQSKVLSSM
ncbi:hypothetical protein BDV95DRAFT_498138 [Massariosphaeria phaeospora]|uniref:Uncharacterized protein n=1 Tax=Massariosphaeria phaeospora TaxID=100035 RepID=A0A7C8M5P7_9PLEO|nr:hypothetical protein BDV95DRAFT_498138 [Massariosphaeria phaeospora]